MQTIIRKKNNQLIIQIPNTIVDGQSFEDGEIIDMQIKKINPQNKFTIDDFMLGLHKTNRHEPLEIDLLGKEILWKKFRIKVKFGGSNFVCYTPDEYQRKKYLFEA